LVEQLDLRRIVLVGQDWGGPIGLSVLAAVPERFVGAVLTNTLLPNCEPPPRGVEDWPGEGIRAWAELARSAEDLPVGEIVNSVAVTPLAPEVVAAYDAPFPDASYKAGVLVFPELIPIADEMTGVAENRTVWRVLEKWRGPLVTAFSDSDPTTKAWEQVFQERVPGAAGQPHVEIAGAGHFVQEEQGPALAAVITGLVERLPAQSFGAGPT
jgi:haloalkane dehalogenase